MDNGSAVVTNYRVVTYILNIKCTNVSSTISLGLGQDMPTDQRPLSRTQLCSLEELNQSIYSLVILDNSFIIGPYVDGQTQGPSVNNQSLYSNLIKELEGPDVNNFFRLPLIGVSVLKHFIPCLPRC